MMTEEFGRGLGGLPSIPKYLLPGPVDISDSSAIMEDLIAPEVKVIR